MEITTTVQTADLFDVAELSAYAESFGVPETAAFVIAGMMLTDASGWLGRVCAALPDSCMRRRMEVAQNLRRRRDLLVAVRADRAAAEAEVADLLAVGERHQF